MHQKRITILQHHQTTVSMDKLHSVDMIVEDNAQVNVYALCDTPQQEKQPITINLTLGEKAVARVFVGVFNTTYLTINGLLIGHKAAMEQRILYFGSERQQMKLRFNSTHRGSETFSRIIARGAMLDHAHADIAGTINIEQTGNNADGRLEHEGVLLSDHARIDSLPRLAIATNNVKASHSSAVHYLQSEQLFYMQSRGLSLHNSRRLIVNGFLSSLLAAVTERAIHHNLQKLLEQKEQLIH